MKYELRVTIEGSNGGGSRVIGDIEAESDDYDSILGRLTHLAHQAVLSMDNARNAELLSYADDVDLVLALLPGINSESESISIARSIVDGINKRRWLSDQ